MTIEKGLLIHWWHYYGKAIYTLAELDEFEKIIDKYGAEKVMEAAVASYIISDGSPTIILVAIRKNNVEKMFDSLPIIENMEVEEKKRYNEVKEKFIKIISETYK